MASDSEVVTFAVDETKGARPGEMSAVVVVRVDEPQAAAGYLRERFARFRRNPTLREVPGFGASSRVGFHFQEDGMEIQQRVLTALQRLSFEAYIAFTTQRSADPDYGWYDDLLRLVLPDRLAEVRHCNVSVVVEAHDRPAGVPGVVGVVEECSRRSRQGVRHRHAGDLRISTDGKANALLWIPDYVLGAFRRYWVAGCANGAAIGTRLYRQIEPRVRLIVNADTGERHHRGSPPSG